MDNALKILSNALKLDLIYLKCNLLHCKSICITGVGLMQAIPMM